MKPRVIPIAIAISSASLLMTACGGSGPGSFTSTPAPTPTPAPTVTVTAPTTATSGVAYDVAWTSTDATSCSANFTSDTGASGSSSKTETVGSKTYTVTCTGAGGSADGSATVHIGPAGAEGAWQGTTTTSNRALSGVVTHEGDYWLAYNATADATSAPAGFYAGSSTNNTLATEDKALRAFDFEGAGAQQGALANVSYATANTLGGSFDTVPAAPAGTWALAMHGDNAFSALNGNLVMDFTGSCLLDGDPTLTTTKCSGAMTGTTHSTGIPLNLTYTQQFFVKPGNGGGSLGAIGPCDDGGNGGVCTAFGSALQGGYFNTVGTTDTDYQTKVPWTPVDGGVYTWTFQFYQTTNPTYIPVPTTVTLSQPLPSIAADAFTSAYDATYEMAPSLDTIAAGGAYTAGSTGIGSTMHADASLTVDSTAGTIAGTESASFCNYSATIAPHATGGNVYDVTAITFSDATPGTCVYTGETFTGVATYKSGTLTLTATNAARNKGFMVVATH